MMESCDQDLNPRPAADATHAYAIPFIHQQHHHDNILRAKICQLYGQYLGKLLQLELSIACPTIAYLRPPNIGEYTIQTKLYEAPGYSSGYYLGEYI